MKLFSVTILFLGAVAVCGISAGGIREYKGQPYMVNEWTPTNIQQFVKAGTFEVEGIQVGPEDSTDGVFKKGVYYWGGPVSLESDSVLRTGWSVHFRLSDKWQTDDEYYWMTARYTGENYTVSKTETYTAYGTITFSDKKEKAVIEIVYLEPYTEESYLAADEPVQSAAETQAADEPMRRRIAFTELPPLQFKKDSDAPPTLRYSIAISLHKTTEPTTAFSEGVLEWDASFTDTWYVPAGTTVCTVLVSIRDQKNNVIRALSKKYVPLEKEIIMLSFDDFQEESVELLEKKFGLQPFSINN